MDPSRTTQGVQRRCPLIVGLEVDTVGVQVLSFAVIRELLLLTGPY